jgi:ankyrin repeat protein
MHNRSTSDFHATENGNRDLRKTPLHIAAEQGDTDRAHALIQQINAQYLLDHESNDHLAAIDEIGRTPLHYAAERGYIEIVRALISTGTDPNKKDNDDSTPLMLAINSARTEVALYLISLENIEIDGPYDGHNPLDSAIKKNLPEVVMALLEKGVNTEITSAPDLSDDIWPLHLAVAYGHTEIVRILIKKDGGVNDTSQGYEYTPLHYAAQYNHIEITRILIGNGADVNATCGEGQTALHIAATHENTAIAITLMGYGAALNAEDYYNNTLLKRAKDNNRTRTQHAMENPLHYAARYMTPDLVALLIAKGYSLTKKINGLTPLELAIANNNLPTTEYLLTYHQQNDHLTLPNPPNPTSQKVSGLQAAFYQPAHNLYHIARTVLSNASNTISKTSIRFRSITPYLLTISQTQIKGIQTILHDFIHAMPLEILLRIIGFIHPNVETMLQTQRSKPETVVTIPPPPQDRTTSTFRQHTGGDNIHPPHFHRIM